MKKWILLLSVSLLIVLAGCAKEKPAEIQFKNDVITIENYVVDNVAPYASTDKVSNTVTISFDIKNNGDKPVKWVKVNFFDTPGFEIKNGLECIKFGKPEVSSDGRSCVFGEDTAGPTTLDVIDPLDTRSVKFTLITRRGITSPTPFTVSFSVTYRYGSIQQANTYFYSGERTAIIPVIDPTFKKEPTSKFFQSDPTIGPIVFDIIPSLEREKIVDGKTIKEYWGVADRAFQTKFVMKKIVSDGAMKEIQPTPSAIGFWSCKFTIKECIEIQLTSNLQIDESTGPCNFYVDESKTKGTTKIIVNEKSNTLVCNFKPTPQGFTSEFTGMITIQYNYDYEIVKKQNFVVYPAIA